MKMFLIIICLGGLLIMWVDLLKLGLEAYKNPFGRRGLTVLMSLFGSLTTFFIGYTLSFWCGGNFLIALMFNQIFSLLPLFGIGDYHFVDGPLLNIFLESGFPILLFLLSFLIPKTSIKDTQNEFKVKADKVIMLENGTKLETDKKLFFLIFRFNALLMLFVQLLLFRFIAYPHFYPLRFNAILCTAALFLTLNGVLTLVGLKIIAVESSIQELFYGNGDEEVINIFELALKDEKVLLEAEQLTPKVEEFILMGIFKTSQSVKNNLFPNASTARLIISENHLALYEKYKSRAIRRSLSPYDYKRFKSTSKLQIPFTNPMLLK